MKIAREWSTPIHVDDVWNEKLSVIPSKAILGFFGGKIETNSLGNRIDNDFTHTFTQDHGCCVGGSTTFGHFCSLGDSYPKLLQEMSGIPIVNLGLAKADLWLGFQSLLDHVRISDSRPNFVIFLDGVNQNSALSQSIDQVANFQILSPLTPQTRLILEGFRSANGKPFKMENLFRFLLGRRYQDKKIANLWNQRKIPNEIQFIGEEAELYVRSIHLVREILDSLGIRYFFCLQPTLYDVWESGDSYQKIYLDQLYSRILSLCTMPIDLRKFASQYLKAEHFIDWAHLNRDGNEALATIISKHVLDF